MARVTIEDCLLYLPNRFELVQHAAKRAREIAQGAKTTASTEKNVKHKCTVASLREIAAGDLGFASEEDNMDALFSELNKLDKQDDDLFGEDHIV